MAQKNLCLIDATAFCYRAFYALPSLATSFGQPTNAIYGFINILNKILKEKKPDYIGVCFDVSRETFRTKKFAAYKIQRPPMPDELSSQIPLIKQIISAYGLSILEKEGFEADDIIATLVKRAKENNLKVTIISSDKDVLQLVDAAVQVFSPYKDAGTTYDRNKVLARFGVAPRQVTDIIALMGDDTDNIPGVRGIGEKTATELIRSFGSLENLLRHLDKVKQDKIKQSIRQNLEQIKLSQELAVLKEDVDIDLGLDKLKIGEPDLGELTRLFKYLEFKKLLKGLLPQDEEAVESGLLQIKDADLKRILSRDEDLVLYGEDSEDLVFNTQGKSFRFDCLGAQAKEMLAAPRIKKTSHDLKKIKVSLARDGIILDGLYFDVMVAAYLINPSKAGYNLADIAWDYLGKLPSSSLDSARGVDLIRQLVPKLEKELQDKALTRLFSDLEMPLVEVLAEMELNGIKLDLKVLSELSRDIEKRLIKLIADIYDLSGAQFNINSPKQLGEILFEKLKLPVVRKSKTGPSTDERVLRILADKHKLPALLLEYRQLTKLKNTYIDTLPSLVDKHTGRIHTSFNQTATETGRLSSSNPNLQNIPIKTEIGKNLRRAIIASGQNYYLISCDYSQIELRILAHLAQDKNLIADFGEDKDIHKATAALIYGLEEKDISDSMREVAKRVNFGIIYGLTAYGLSRDLGISPDQAQGFIEAYFLKYPEVKEYIQGQIKKAQEFGFVTTILGRRRYIPEINNKNQAIRQFAERQAVNTPIQGSASDLIKLAMIKIHEQLRQKKLKARMSIQIHDELVFDAPQEELDELVALVRERMENVLKLDVPIRVEIKKGKNWLEMEEIE